MKNILLITLAIFAFTSCQQAEKAAEIELTETTMEETMPTKQLRHVVLFKFKDESTPEDVSRIEDAFLNLPNEIPQIQSIEWGTNNSPEGLNQGLTHCFFLTFASEEDRDIYLPHPAHKAFGEMLGGHLDKVTVVDYWVK
ncbi:Stress responsive A/B Barrel Domain [Spirosomataceae bacterium TFI 002]|nr:Stress responsive A/B Barrel Domain [Spirosomataceae bacterium TFI 002]